MRHPSIRQTATGVAVLATAGYGALLAGVETGWVSMHSPWMLLALPAAPGVLFGGGGHGDTPTLGLILGGVSNAAVWGGLTYGLLATVAGVRRARARVARPPEPPAI